MPPKPETNPTAFYPTPQPVIDIMLGGYPFSCLHSQARILEPSAGRGVLALAIRDTFLKDGLNAPKIDCCEILDEFRDELAAHGFHLVGRDFLAYRPDTPYSAVIMNPPFSVMGERRAYQTHIRHAWEMLDDGGVLIAVAPADYIIYEDTQSLNFLHFVLFNGRWEELAPNAFRESGAQVSTTIISMVKADQSWCWTRPVDGWQSWNCLQLNRLTKNDFHLYREYRRIFDSWSAGVLPTSREHPRWPESSLAIRSLYNQTLFNTEKPYFLP
jgi:hypothetical protein